MSMGLRYLVDRQPGSDNESSQNVVPVTTSHAQFDTRPHHRNREEQREAEGL